MIVGHSEVVRAQDELGRQLERPLVALDRQVQRALVKVHGPEQMIRQCTVRLGLNQSLELPPGFPVLSLALGHQGVQQALVHECVSEEQAALGAEFVRIGGLVAAA